MLSKNINFRAFNYKPVNKKLKKYFLETLSKNNEILKSLTPSYKYNYSKNLIKKFKKEKVLKIIGMGGSILGTRAIHDYLKHKIKKKIIFFDNIETDLKIKKKGINLIISKSGNTLETIVNSNIIIKKSLISHFIIQEIMRIQPLIMILKFLGLTL